MLNVRTGTSIGSVIVSASFPVAFYPGKNRAVSPALLHSLFLVVVPLICAFSAS